MTNINNNNKINHNNLKRVALDYTQKRPVSNLGKEVWASDREQRVIGTLKNINERYGIFFIYSSTCQYCVKYAQILDDLRKFYKLEIKGVSIDEKFKLLNLLFGKIE